MRELGVIELQIFNNFLRELRFFNFSRRRQSAGKIHEDEANDAEY